MIRRLGPEPPPLEMGEITDPVEVAKAQAQWRAFDLNLKWFQARAAEAYERHRGKFLAIAGEELFVADTAEEVFALARAAHPEDEGPFTLYVPRERMLRIYANRRTVASLC